ncbi:AAA family ATPase [Microvirga thermotolerans]|uniref:AAA family ATPase n=1 Tax=Microvirga thermotolerans TaxID=2651334 RepID=A0A5P9JZ63_9HYPH|nr:AAA family ATPase [Microvirga thermotolerans]QFU16926.1 AAA family ATPase [Microvirga thermotolerans]
MAIRPSLKKGPRSEPQGDDASADEAAPAGRPRQRDRLDVISDPIGAAASDRWHPVGRPNLTFMIGEDPEDWFAPIDRLIKEYDGIQPEADLRFADLHGLGPAKAWAEGLVRDLRDYSAGRIALTDLDRGCLLAGPPGTGKTTLARVLAREAEVNLIATSAATWLSHSHLGEVIQAVRLDFAAARERAPCVLFIDEVDGLSDRTVVEPRYRSYWTSFIGCVLEEMDGLRSQPGVVVIGATNFLKAVDPALLRSGRLERVIHVPVPSTEELARILWQKLASDLPGADLMPLAVLGLGGTGADAERWVRGARRRARHAGRRLTFDDLMAEIAGRVDAVSTELLRRCAVHEAGHAIAAVASGEAVSVEISIVGQGRHAGTTRVAGGPEQPMTPEIARQILVYLLAGRAAEEVVLGGVSAGAGGAEESDLAVATRLAVRMLTAYGLAGPAPLVYLGANLPASHLPPHLLAEVRHELNAAYKEATALIRAHQAAVEQLAAYLADRLAASDAAIRAIFEAHSSTRGFPAGADTRH